MILPAMGMVSDILAVFARKPIFGYRPMVYAMAGIAFLGFIVWAHHMFQSGMNPTLGTTFAVSTMFIAVPSAIKTFNWLGTLWGGNIRFTAAMCNAIAFVAMFVIGGPVGHLHGLHRRSTCTSTTPTSSSPTFTTCCSADRCSASWAAIYFWYPKMFGRMMNETLGKIHFWLTFIFFNGTFFAMHILGIGGMPRRVADYMNYDTFAHFQPMNQFISISAFGLGLSQISVHHQLHRKLDLGQEGAEQPVGTRRRWNGPTRPAPRRTETSRRSRSCITGPYEYSIAAGRGRLAAADAVCRRGGESSLVKH